MTKKTLLVLLTIMFAIIFSNYSCSSDEPEIIPKPIPEPEQEIDHIRMNAYPNVVDLFELSEIKISTQKIEDYLTLVFYLQYQFDSIKWDMPDIFTNISKDGKVLTSVGQSFCLPGKYKMAASGYKDGKIISTDTAYIQVVNNKDFMGLNWKDNNKEKEFFNYISKVGNFYMPFTYCWENTEYALIEYRPYDINKETNLIYAKGRVYLSDLMTELYGEANLRYDGEDILKSPLALEYQNKFKTSLEDLRNSQYYKTIPLAIWETPSTYIALIGIKDIREDGYADQSFKIIAEPRNK